MIQSCALGRLRRLPALLLLPTLFALAPSRAAVLVPGNNRDVSGPAGVVGYWSGTMTEQGASLPVSFRFFKLGKTLSGDYSSVPQSCLDFPLDSVAQTASSVTFALGGELTFHGRANGDTMSGSFADGSRGGAFALIRALPPPAGSRRVDVTFRNGGVTDAGTLCLPLDREGGRSRYPAVVLLQGSGPETRWGTNLFFADQFARHGVAALCFDKRGCGASSGDWRKADFGDVAGDALAAVRLLRARGDINAAAVGLMGHSQGGLIAPLAAAKAAPGEVAFLLAEDCPAGPEYEQDIFRERNALAAQGYGGAALAHILGYYRQFIQVALTGKGWPAFEAATRRVQSQKWFADMAIPPRGSWIYNYYQKTGGYDPLPYWREARVPVLLVYGERDELVPADRSIRQIESTLAQAGDTDYTSVIIPEAAHNLTIAPQAGQPFFWWHIAPGLSDLQVAWVAERFASVRASAPQPQAPAR